jgi:hypothetical protein
LQVVTLMHVRSQLPALQFCWKLAEPLPLPSHEPFEQFWVHVAPEAHWRLHAPSEQLTVHVEPSSHCASHVSAGEQVNVHLAPVGQTHWWPDLHVSETGPPDDPEEEEDDDEELVAPLEDEELDAPDELVAPDDPDDEEPVPGPTVLLEHAPAARKAGTMAKRKRVNVIFEEPPVEMNQSSANA